MCLIYRLLSYYRSDVAVMGRGGTPAQQQPHSTSGDEWKVRFNTLSVERDHPTDQMSTNTEDSDDGNEKQRLQVETLLDLGRSARPMGRGCPFDDDGRSLLPIFRLTDDFLHGGAVVERMLTKTVSRNTIYAKQTMFDASFRPSVTEVRTLLASNTTTFDQPSTGDAI